MAHIRSRRAKPTRGKFLRSAFDRLEDRTAPATGSIQGSLWEDTNASQTRDAGEAVLAGRTVYLDLDRDGRLDAAEPTALTAADGSYGFTGLAPGPYHVAQVLPDGWQQTAPGTYPTRSVLLQETSQRDQFSFDALGRTTGYDLPDAYAQAGYTIDTTAENVPKLHVYGSTETARYGGSPALTIANWPTTISIRRDDGAPFTIRTIDLAEIWSSVYTPTVTFKGTKTDGRVVQQSFQLDNVFNNTNAFQTFTFTGFDDVVSVDWFTHDVNDAHQFDDVVVEAGGSLNAVGVDLGSRAQATPGLTVRDYSVFEQNGGVYYVTYYVELSAANSLPVNVYYSTEGGGTAGAGQDYRARSGRIVFQPGETVKYISIRTFPDAVPEADETIKIDAWGAVNARILDNQALITLYNDDLTAAADAYGTNQGVTLDVAAPGVFANDGNPSPVTATVVSTPAHGTLTFAADGSFRYAPAPGYTGSDAFSYRTQRTISGLFGTQDSFTTFGPTAVVNLTIQAINSAPTANADSYTVAEDSALVVPAPQGPVLRYGFDEASSGSDPALDSGTAPSANASLLTGATRTGSTPGGGSRGALDLTAENAYLNVAGPAADVEKVDALPALTVTLWVNLRGTPNQNDLLLSDIPGLSSASIGEGGWQLKIVSPPGSTLSAGNFAYQFDLFEKDGAGSGHGNGIISTPIDANQKWVFLAVTVDPTRFVRTYRGAEAGAVTAMNVLNSQVALLNNRVPLRIGGSTEFPNNDVTPPAWIDDVRIYDRALSAGELEAVRQQALAREGGVLANDSDPNNDPLSAVVVTPPANGSLTFFPDGTFHYLPNPNFHGTDTFTYKVSDGTLESAPATVTITVTPVNDAPTGTLDTYATVEDTPLTIAAPGVLGNDADIDGDPLTATVAVAPVLGTVVLNPNGSFTYTPTPNYYSYTGTVPAYDTFFYRVSDGTAQSNLIPVRISISPVNDPPLATDDAGQVLEDNGPQAIDVLTNDSLQFDPDETLAVVGVTQPAHGTVSFTATGVLYTPAANYNGPDSFTYTVTDGNGGSATATVAVDVLNANDSPTAVDDAYSLDEETTLVVPAAQGVLINDNDIDGDFMMADVVIQPEHGTLAFGNDGSFIYSPFQNFAGVDRFSYSTRDFNGGTSAVAVVHLTVRQRNDPPAGAEDAYATPRNTALVVAAPGVLANDTDIDGDVLTAALYSGPSNGTLDLQADGSFTYTPAPGFQGLDFFTYRAIDPSGSSAFANVTITISSVNQVPVSSSDGVTTLEDGAVGIAVLANDFDPDGDPLIPIIASQPVNGSVVVNPDRTITFTPAANFHGTTSFTYVASDGASQSSPATVVVTVTPVNDPPTAAGDAADTAEDTAVTIAVLGNDGDADGDPLSVILISVPAHGLATLNADGTITYTPAANSNGTDSFSYRVSDGQASSAVATVTITVRPVNDRPVAFDQTTAAVTEDGAVGIALTGADAADGGVSGDLIYRVTTLPTRGVLFKADGTRVQPGEAIASPGGLRYEPAVGLDDVADDAFQFTVTDRDPAGALTSTAATVRVPVVKAVADGLATLANGILRVSGTAAADLIDVRQVRVKGRNVVRVTINNRVVADNLNPDLVSEVRVWGRAGGDQVRLNGLAVDALLVGGLDADTLTGGAGINLLFGGGGDDSLNGATASDLLVGGAGRDVLGGDAGPDVLIGGSLGTPQTLAEIRRFRSDWAANLSPDQTRLGVVDPGDQIDTLSGGTGRNLLITGPNDLIPSVRSKKNR